MDITSTEPSTSCSPPPVVKPGVMCTMCSRKFASIKLLNRHKQRIHKIVSASKKSRIICPLCEETLKTHEVLRYHLVNKHEINIELLILQFSSIEEYESWKTEENVDSGYAMYNTNRCNDHKELNYICNRSDTTGYQANYQRRREKLGGTIKIRGMCPSKLTCKLYDNGIVSLAFWKTHVGHERELRSLHLSKAEQDIIVNKMKSGVSIDRILEDTRNLKGPELKRINLINRNNLIYLARKHNIHNNKRHGDEMAAAVKLQEWNGNGKNSTYFHKQEVEALEENSAIKSQNEKESEEIVEEKLEDQDKREVKWTNFKNWAEALNEEIFNKFMNNIQGAIRKADQARQGISNRRKMKTQELFSSKKS